MDDATRAKLEAARDLITEGSLADEKIAGIAGVNVADVAAYRAEIGAGAAVSKSKVQPGKGALRRSTTPPTVPDEDAESVLELARAAKDLIDQGWTLQKGKLRPPKARGDNNWLETGAGLAIPLIIQLLSRFVTTHTVNGRPTPAVFQPSVYRGEMAQLIRGYAVRDGREDLIEVLEG